MSLTGLVCLVKQTESQNQGDLFDIPVPVEKFKLINYKYSAQPDWTSFSNTPAIYKY